MRIGIVLLPDKATETMAKKYSSVLNQKFPCLFQLDQTHIPHATLLHLLISDKDLPKLFQQVNDLSKKYQKITVKNEIAKSGMDAKTFIGVYFKKDDEIVRLRQDLYQYVSIYATNISPFRKPHITITRLQKESDVKEAIIQLNRILEDLSVFPTIAICEVRENGICSNIISSYPLI